MINTVEPPPKIPWFSIRLGTHNSTIRCATTVTPQCGPGRLREMVFYEKYQRGVARSHARANLVSRALFPGFGGGAGIANWRHCFEGLQHYFNITTLCCAKNRRCKSSCVTSPLRDQRRLSQNCILNAWYLFVCRRVYFRNELWYYKHCTILRSMHLICYVCV